MNDRVLRYAIIASIALHMAAVCVVGGTSSARFQTASPPGMPRFIKVDLIDEPAKPKPAPPKIDPLPKPQPPAPEIVRPIDATPVRAPDRSVNPFPAAHPRISTPPRATNRLPGNPGGKLNVGSLSAHGDLRGNWGGGRTPVGWVSGAENGKGRGSGNGEGVGQPDPPANAHDGPGTRPAPAPPPPPKMVSVRVCEASGMLAGENCKRTRGESFVEGSQPSRTCNKCEAEHKSRLADQEKPVLTRDARVSIPGSVEEGLSVTVRVEYTVTADGDVTGIQVTKSSDNRAIDRAAVDATSRRKYKPAVQDGVPRSVKMSLTYTINT